MIETVQIMPVFRRNPGVYPFFQLLEEFLFQFKILSEIGNLGYSGKFSIKFGLMPDIEVRPFFKIENKNGEERKQAANHKVYDCPDYFFAGGEQEMFHDCLMLNDFTLMVN
jgi:hypothetical protein